MNMKAKGHWYWGKDWDRLEIDPYREEPVDKYLDLALYNPHGDPVINLQVDHYQFEWHTWDGELIRYESVRERITEALNWGIR